MHVRNHTVWFIREQEKTAESLRELVHVVSAVLVFGDPCHLWNLSVFYLHFAFLVTCLVFLLCWLLASSASFVL